MNLIINGNKTKVTPVSKLTGNEFVEIMIKANVTDLKEYIALFAGISINTLMDAKFSTTSLKGLHASIFDINIEKYLKNPPLTLDYEDDIYIVKEMALDTFGKRYMFELHYDKFKIKQIDLYALSVYCLACAISNDYDTGRIQKIYESLMNRKWTEVIPAAFFLTKRSWKGKRNSMLMWMIFMWGLKIQRLKMQYKISTSNITKRN